jgi:hypothetical protein
MAWGSGALADVPIVGDFDGDGQIDLTVWRPGNGIWYIRTSSTQYAGTLSYSWGAGSLNDRPIGAAPK